ncbi:MAG: glycosyltransferase family protein [Azospirillum sp.]|nr:glycosyltransferase family protein [Azospirillum sp.]
MNTAITIQARMTSTRLPGKVIAPLCGAPALERMIERLRRVRGADCIVLCTTTNAADDVLVDLAQRLDVGYHRGSENDVLSRVLDAARAYGVETIVETTGDCPLIDPTIVDEVIDRYRSAPVDYCSNILERCYPIGMDTQVFSTAVLADVARRTNDPEDREHVSLYIYSHPEIYSLLHVAAPPHRHRPSLRLTLDTPEDLELLQRIYDSLYPSNPTFGLDDMLMLIDAHPDWVEISAHVQHRWIKR